MKKTKKKRGGGSTDDKFIKGLKRLKQENKKIKEEQDRLKQENKKIKEEQDRLKQENEKIRKKLVKLTDNINRGISHLFDTIKKIARKGTVNVNVPDDYRWHKLMSTSSASSLSQSTDE